jgi:AcrR family transcriptional regulator
VSSGRRNQSLQDRSRRTRERLIEVGFSLFAEHGVDRVTVDAICDAAGVAKGTFYFHYPTKQALLVAAFHRAGDDVARHAEALVASETPFVEAVLALGGRIARNTSTVPKPLVRRATVETLAAIDSDPDDTERHHRRDALLVLVEAGTRRGEIRTDFQPAEIAMALNWAIVQSILVWTAAPDRTVTLETVTRRRLTMTLVGVAAGA